MKPAKDPVLAVLERGLGRVKRGWRKGAMASTKEGDRCATTSRKAAKWCAWGAIYDATRSSRLAYFELDKALPTRARGLAQWNDAHRRKKSDVIALYKRAIAARKRKVKA